MADLVILGSGAGFATAARFSTSIALVTRSETYIFDCGEPCAALLFRNGIDPMSVKSVFISHMHPDHVGGLAALLFSMYLPGRDDTRKFRPWSVSRHSDWYQRDLRQPVARRIAESGSTVTVMLPSEAIEPIHQYLTAVYLPDSILPYTLRLLPVTPGPTYEDGIIAVTAVPNAHLSANAAYRALPGQVPHLALQSYSYLVTIAGHRFVFSGDIDALHELDPLVTDADTLLIEVAHTDPEAIGEYIKDLPASRVVLTHIHPGLEQRIRTLVEDWRDPRIELAYDGYRIPIP